MKVKRLLFPFLFLIILFFDVRNIDAAGIKIFSKYNYYTTEQYATVVCILPDSTNVNDQAIRVLNGKNEFPEPITGSVTRINIPLTQLPMGHSAFPVQLLSDQKILKDTVVDFVRLKPAANEVKIDRETGGLVVDGLPFFPVGFYCEKVGQLPEQEVVNGFNLIGPYQSNLPDGLAARKSYMDRCARLGIKVQYSVNSLIGSGHNGAKGLELTEAEKLALLKKEILTFKDHPALLSWYINDEPAGQGRDPGLLEKAYRFIHELDPYHPVSIVFMTPSKAGEYRGAMDIAMTDPYPIPNSVSGVQDYVRQMNANFRNQKSIWLVPQAFGGQEMWPREPTPKEIRVMTYLGLVEGVQGIQYYVHRAANLNPQSVAAWSECRNIATEISQMTPFLLSGDKSEFLKTDQENILARRFLYQGNELILVVNKSNEPAMYTVSLNENRNTKAELWFENRQVACQGGKIRDMIDGLSTRVYLIRKQTDDSLKSVYPGNLIYNPGFEEVVTPGLASGHHLSFAVPDKADPGATVFSDSRQSAEGLFSLRLVTPADRAGKKILFLPVAVSKGTTYRLSVRARSTQQAAMPCFRLAVKALKLEETATLTSQWKEYSFLVKSDSSSTNAIVELELADQGTAWFDLLQLTPEPFLSYKIDPRQKNATVSIQTSIPDATLKYRYAKEKSHHPFSGYQHPFIVANASTVEAEVFLEGEKLAEGSLFVPINKALGKPVLFETKYSSQYQAQGDSSLTNGSMGSTLFKDGNWLGFLDPQVAFRIDLGKETVIHTVTPDFLCDPNSGIFLPREIAVYSSSDGNNFHLAARKTNDAVSRRGEPYIVPFTMDCGALNTRYIRVVIKTFGQIPDGYLFKGTTSWLFTDEVVVQ